MKEDVKVMEAQIKELEARGITLPQVERKILEKKIAKAKEREQPDIYMTHYNYRVFKGTCQTAWFSVINPSSESELWFDGSVKYFIGHGSVIDPDANMTRPSIPGAFHCRDKRFPEFMRRVFIGPGAYLQFQQSFHVPEDIEAGWYFGNAFLIEFKQPFPVFVTGYYAIFEVLSCADDP